MYENIKRLTDFDFQGKKVVMRVDFNIPFDKERNITSTKRIDAALPTIKHILENGAERLVLMSHLGKPKKLAKKGEDFTTKLSLDIVAKKLGELLGQEVTLAKDYVEQDLPEGNIILLENTRFYYEQEQAKTKEEREPLAKRLASFGDIFINDAFGTCHREQASVYDIATFLPSGIGFLIEKEIEEISKLTNNPKKPFIAILGGAKVEDKIKIIDALSEKVDHIFIIGAMDYAFKKAQGVAVGNSLCEGVETAQKVLATEVKEKIILPVDAIVAKRNGEEWTDIKTVEGDIPEGYAGLDIGEKSVAAITEACKNAETIFWNGPAGLCEVQPFDKATNAIAQALSTLQSIRIVGGGDSVTAIEKAGLQDTFTHISTGGGASLEMIENNGKLPALDILSK